MLFPQQLRAGRGGHLEDVEGHRDERVVADEAGEIDRARFAEALFDARQGCIVDPMVVVVIAAEIIDQLLVGVVETRRAALGWEMSLNLRTGGKWETRENGEKEPGSEGP